MSRQLTVLFLAVTVLSVPRATSRAQTPVFRAGAAATSINVSVKDRNRAIAGLTASDFMVTDNGVPQTVEVVSTNLLPIDVTIVLDVSGSAPRTLLKDVASIRTLLRPADHLEVQSFATTARSGVASVPAPRGPASVTTVQSSEATALFNALTAALVPSSLPGRPRLVVTLTDGGDNISLLSDRDVLETARRSDSVLNVLLRVPGGGFSVIVWGSYPRRWLPFDPPKSFDLLRQAAESTGGRLNIAADDQPTDNLFKQVIEEFRSGYLLWFTPTGVPATGWHELAVKVPSGKYTVAARRGYFGG